MDKPNNPFDGLGPRLDPEPPIFEKLLQVAAAQVLENEKNPPQAPVADSLYPTTEQKSAFLSELEQLCQKHNISISHEDWNGDFQLDFYDQDSMNWLKQTC